VCCFFFSSRRRHTRFSRDWSSDVCSSDLRRSDDYVPKQTQYHLPIEVLYTVAPLIVVAVFFFHTVDTQREVLEPVDNPDHEITVVAQKWAWTSNYLEEDAVDGQSVYDVGTPDQFAELWLPVA